MHIPFNSDDKVTWMNVNQMLCMPSYHYFYQPPPITNIPLKFCEIVELHAYLETDCVFETT